MPNPKHIKLGVIFLVVVATALGIGIGIGTKNKDKNLAGSSFKSKEIDVLDSIYDIDCEERRILTAPGNEEYPIAITAPTERRVLIRRLGKEAAQTSSDAGPKVVSASSKTSKSERTSSRKSKSSKGLKSKKNCIKPSKSDKCASKRSRDVSVTIDLDGPTQRRKLRYEKRRELGKETVPPPSQ